MATQLDERSELTMHVRFRGRSFDVPLNVLGLSASDGDGEIKRRLSQYLETPATALADCVIDRHANGNLTLRPEAVFG